MTAPANIDHSKDPSTNLQRIISQLETEPNSEVLLKKIAPFINWNEEASRHIKENGLGRSSEWKDATRDSLFSSLSEKTLISLMSPSLFKANYSNMHKVPYTYCFDNSRFEFLKEYISEFSSYIEEHLKDKTNNYIYPISTRGDNSVLSNAFSSITRNFSPDSYDGQKLFDFSSIDKVNDWFKNIFLIIDQASAFEPNLNLANASQSKKASAKAIFMDDGDYMRKQLSKDKELLLNSWLICAYLSTNNVKDGEYIRTQALISTYSENKKPVTLKDSLLALLDGPAKKEGYRSSPLPSEEIKSKFLHFIARHLTPIHFADLLGQITALPATKAQNCLDLLTQELLSSISFEASALTRSSHTVYSQRSFYETEAKKEIDSFINLRENFLVLQNMLNQPSSGFKLNISNENNTDILEALLETLPLECPVMVDFVLKIMPDYCLKIEKENFTLPEAVFLYKRAQELAIKANLKSSSSVVLHSDKKSIKEQLTHNHALKTKKSYDDQYYRLSEHYNVRREQYIDFGAKASDFPSVLDLNPLIETLTDEQKNKINNLLYSAPNIITRLPGWKEKGFAPLTAIAWEKFVLEEKVAPTQNAKKEKSLKI